MHFELPIPIWAIVLLLIVIVIPTYVLIAGRNAEGGMKGRASHGWSRWRELSQKAADVQARVLLTVFYFTLLAPFALLVRLSSDPLGTKRHAEGPAWTPRRERDRGSELDGARRQF